LRLALEALKSISEMVDYEGNGFKLEYEIKALEEALAKQEQGKPLCWEDVCPNKQACCDAETCLYTTPYVPEGRQQRPSRSDIKPLTDEHIFAIGKELGLKCRLGGNPNIDIDYARAIEAAHGIRPSDFKEKNNGS
jgi:hypothetical protein